MGKEDAFPTTASWTAEAHILPSSYNSEKMDLVLLWFSGLEPKFYWRFHQITPCDCLTSHVIPIMQFFGGSSNKNKIAANQEIKRGKIKQSVDFLLQGFSASEKWSVNTEPSFPEQAFSPSSDSPDLIVLGYKGLTFYTTFEG